ncbi:chromate efflux transporter [Agarivorans sp. Toyoura001]|uniref:chromate efflux transporter n=1 Tax=unclassified Agarivorans TaxID=2636026 RepID=UPI00191E2BB4|nr:chromate efflux transporter [Agarivorans sp. Toyoura001]
MTAIFEVFSAFFRLGLVSFGGPAAHIGFFKQEFVDNKQWLSQHEYANLVALSQFLPGPGSSQVGFAIGLHRAGKLGAIAAFIGFTLPSAALMLVLALAANYSNNNPFVMGLIAGLKVAALVVVVDAVRQMYRQFCSNRYLSGACFITAASLLLFPQLSTQLVCLALTALIGLALNEKLLVPNPPTNTNTSTNQTGSIKFGYLAVFIALLFLPFLNLNPLIHSFSQFYQAGSWVFGGGHVVLPLLQQTLSGDVNQEQFLTAYAAAQAVPGPMFTIASYLGAVVGQQNPLVYASLATIAIFLPGFLLVLAFVDAWQALAQKAKFSAAMQMVNAAVVGLLIAALYNPIFTSAIHSNLEFVLALLGFFLLRVVKLPLYIMLLSLGGAGILLLA